MTILQPPVMAPTTLPDIVVAPPVPAEPLKPQRLLSLDVFRGLAIGAGFAGYKALRVLCFLFVWGGLFALLIPWRSRRLQTIIPLAVAVGFYLLMIGMHFATKRAHAAGLEELGGGIFNPDNLRIP